MTRALAIAALLAVSPAYGAAIRHHVGGHGWETSWLRTGELKILGVCNSACAWNAWANPQMCYGPGAEFYFHTPRDKWSGNVLWGAVAFYVRQTPYWAYPELRVNAGDLAKLAPERRCK